MADHTTSTHRRDLRTAAAEPLADLVGHTAPDDAPAPDPAVAAYHRLRAVVAADGAAGGTAQAHDAGAVAAAEDALIATRAVSPAGVGAKLVELAGHEGWFAHHDHYQTRLIHSALADLRGLEGRS